MLKNYLRQYRLGGFYFDAPNDNGGGDNPEVTTEEPSEEGLTLDEMTNRRIQPDAEPTDSSDPYPSGEVEDKDEVEVKGEDEDEGDDTPDEPDQSDEEVDEPEDTDEVEGEDEVKGEDEGEDEPFYDPEKYKKSQEIDRDIPHTNTFKDRESAEFAAVNKASVLADTIDEMKDLDIDHGAVRLPDALNGSLDNLKDLENVASLAQMEPDDLNKFLWQSDEFRHRLQGKIDRTRQSKQSAEVSETFETLQKDLYDGVSKVMGGEENLTDEVVKTLDSGKAQGRKFLQAKIDERVNSELEPDVQAIEDFIDSDEAADLSRKEFVNKLEAKKSDLASKRQRLKDEYGSVVETFDEAFDLAPKVQQSKPKTEAQVINTAWKTLDEWQKDQEGHSKLLIDDPGAKRELEAWAKTAIQNREKFNNLQHPSDWNNAEEWWYNTFKPSIRGNQQRKDVKGNKKSSKPKGGKGGDDIPTPDPDKQEGMRAKDGEDVYQMNKSNLDTLEELTNA